MIIETKIDILYCCRMFHTTFLKGCFSKWEPGGPVILSIRRTRQLQYLDGFPLTPVS